MVLLEFSMTPLGQGESISQYVAKSVDIIEQSGLEYQLTAMGTIIEGEWEEVFQVVQECYEEMSKSCNRVTCTIKVDARKGPAGRIASKVESVEKKR